MDLREKVWSFSSVKMYEQCPYSFYLHYIEDKYEAPNAFSQSGGYVHELLAKAYNGELLEFELADEFEEHYSEYVTQRFPYHNIAKSFYETSVDYLSVFEIDNEYEIVGVEKEIKCQIQGYEFIGYIDLLLRDKADNKLVVVDHKSKSSFKGGEKKEYLKQLYLYCYAIHKEYGEFPKELCFNLYRAKKIVKTDFNEENYKVALDWFKNTIDAIMQEQNWDCKIDKWFCDNLCGFAECPYNGRDLDG